MKKLTILILSMLALNVPMTFAQDGGDRVIERYLARAEQVKQEKMAAQLASTQQTPVVQPQVTSGK